MPIDQDTVETAEKDRRCPLGGDDAELRRGLVHHEPIPDPARHILDREEVAVFLPRRNRVPEGLPVLCKPRQSPAGSPLDHVFDPVPHSAVVDVVVTGYNEGNMLLNKELMQGIPGCGVSVHAVSGQEREEGFMEKDEFVLEGPVQFGGQPCKLFSGNPASFARKLCVEEDKESVFIGKRVIGGLKESEVSCVGRMVPHIVVSWHQVQKLVRSRDPREVLPLASTTPVSRIARVYERRDTLTFDPLDEFGIHRIWRAHVAIAHYRECGAFCPENVRGKEKANENS